MGKSRPCYRQEIPPDRRFCGWTADDRLLNDDHIYYASDCRGDEPGISGYPWHYYALTPRELKPLTDDERRDAAKVRFNYGR